MKAKGLHFKYRPRIKVTKSDLKEGKRAASSHVSCNRRFSGNFARFHLAAWFRAFVGALYKLVGALSRITRWSRMEWIRGVMSWAGMISVLLLMGEAGKPILHYRAVFSGRTCRLCFSRQGRHSQYI